jgi:hypothetical protein
LLGEEGVEDLVEAGRINTDDNALIEFSAPKDLLAFSGQDARLGRLEESEGERLIQAEPYFAGFDFHGAASLTVFADRLVRQGRLADAGAAIAAIGTASASLDAASASRLGRVQALLARMEEADQEPVVVASEATIHDARYAEAVSAMLDGKERDALAVLDAEDGFEKKGPAHRFLYAYLSYRQERTYDAEWLIDEVLQDQTFVRENPAVLYYAARIQTDRGRYDRAYDLYQRFLDSSAQAPEGQE